MAPLELDIRYLALRDESSHSQGKTQAALENIIHPHKPVFFSFENWVKRAYQ